MTGSAYRQQCRAPPFPFLEPQVAMVSMETNWWLDQLLGKMTHWGTTLEYSKVGLVASPVSRGLPGESDMFPISLLVWPRSQANSTARFLVPLGVFWSFSTLHRDPWIRQKEIENGSQNHSFWVCLSF